MNDKRTFSVMMLAGAVWAIATRAVGDDASQPRTSATPPASGGLFAQRKDRSGQDAADWLDGATGWLNTAPLTAAALRGKVVLVDFWTYSCINWRREYAYVRAWASKYRDQGLVVIGVHSPEFTFEKNVSNVERAVRDIGVDYPVAIDTEHAIWRAFGNAYWPALYFMDANGRRRHHHFGEGDYDSSERVIQQLLAEAGAAGVRRDLVVPSASGAEAQPDWANLKSAETYVGYARMHGLASPGAALNKRRVYEAPTRLNLNQWALAGGWTLRDEAAVSDEANGRVAFVFHARDLHLVMGPALHGSQVRFRVSIDGAPPGRARGLDVDEQGVGTISQHRMYQLIRQPERITNRRFEIEFSSPGVELFSFTFG